MISTATGNLLTANVDALVNTVNTVGVMGKGLALQVRRAYPAMYEEYSSATKRGEVQLGKMHVWATDAISHPRYVINFPTKGHWRSRSRLADIRTGLNDLVRVVEEYEIRSLAVPPLGCGNGGLAWPDVEPLIREAFIRLPEVQVELYLPGPTPAAKDMRSGMQRPAMTAGRAALVTMLRSYQEIALSASLIEVQKLMYFMQVAGEPLRLRFEKGYYGPYADNLRHVLNHMEGHQLLGFGDGSSPVLNAEGIRILPGAAEEAAGVLAAHPDTLARVERVAALAEGFESTYGMELLASVHWVATQTPDTDVDADTVTSLLQGWTNRKQQMFTHHHVLSALNALIEGDWLPTRQLDVATSEQAAT